MRFGKRLNYLIIGFSKTVLSLEAPIGSNNFQVNEGDLGQYLCMDSPKTTPKPSLKTQKLRLEAATYSIWDLLRLISNAIGEQLFIHSLTKFIILLRNLSRSYEIHHADGIMNSVL